MRAFELLVATGLAKSNSQAKRLIRQGAMMVYYPLAVRSKKVEDLNKEITPEDGMVIRVGKRKFIKVKLSGKDNATQATNAQTEAVKAQG